MIWNDDVLFIHAPKTAGMSLTAVLTANLSGKVFMTGHSDTETRSDLTLLPGKRHETMAEAQQFLKIHGRELSEFKLVFAVMREPYTLEISRYNYLRLNHPWDRGSAQKIALEGSFKSYLENAPFFGHYPPRLDLYYHIDNLIPSNVVYFKYEHINQDIKDHLFPFLKHRPVFPHENKTGDSSFNKYYDAEAEDLCYRRHRWFFDKGFYRRKRSIDRIEEDRPHSVGSPARRWFGPWFTRS